MHSSILIGFVENTEKRALMLSMSATPIYSLFSRTTWVSWYQKVRTILDFNEARDDGWQWHKQDHMRIICNSLQTDYYASTSHTTHAHTITACFAVVPRLCHLILVSLSTFYLEFYLVASRHTSI